MKEGWKQVTTYIQVDNSTALGIEKKESHQKKSKEMDMQLYWKNNII